MASTLAEMMFQSASNTVGQTADIAGSMAKGAQLGMQIEQTQQERQKLEQLKQEMQMKKIDSITQSFELAAQAKDPKTRNFLLKNVVPGKIKALGLEQFFNPQTLEMIQTSPEALDKFRGLKIDLESRVRRGEMNMAEAYQEFAAKAASDPEEVIALDTDRFAEAEKFSLAETGKSQRVELGGQIGLGKQVQGQQVAGQVEARKKVSDAWTTWQTGGGLAARKKAEGIFEQAIEKLRSGKVRFGTTIKKLPYASKEDVLARIDPEAKALIDDIRGGISIKEKTGDPNPALPQIEAILSRSIDPRLDNQKNIEKLETELKFMREDTDNKVKEFSRFGHPVSESKAQVEDGLTVRGVKIPMSKLKNASDKVLKQIADETGITVEELKKKAGL
jgi:hypothetical protein